MGASPYHAERPCKDVRPATPLVPHHPLPDSFPLSLLFRLLVALRRALYRGGILPSYKLPCRSSWSAHQRQRTGKTPLTLALAQQRLDRGRHPLIVSALRRHRTTTRHVDADSDATVGDEPLLMARRKPARCGSEDRAAAAQAALQAHPQCDVVLCDDGAALPLAAATLKSRSSTARGFGNGLMLPPELRRR
jgi:tetraacyldisaccharide 4'-kinase